MTEMVLSNMVMISHVPAQTFREKERAQLLLERFIECGLPDPFTDSLNNVIGIRYCEKPKHKILLFAHMDHQFDESVEQDITINARRAKGTGIANDTAGLGVLMSIPDIIDRLDLDIQSDIILLASTQSHGRGDFAGIRYFLNNNTIPIDFVLNLGGVTMGRFDYSSLSRVRGDIICRTSEPTRSETWGKFGYSSANMVLSEIMSKLYSISLPRQPKTVLNIGMISGGESYSSVSTEASLNLEVLSEDDTVTDKLIDQINDTCIDIGAKHGVEVTIDFFGRHYSAGLSPSHPFVKAATAIVTSLGYNPIMEYSNSEIAVPLAMNIPTLTLAVSTGNLSNTPKGYIDLEPIPTGILQIVMLLYAIDKGFCDDRPE
jgi:acetylornithine deacetylase/succinyl-diaminopimelate desuccinylase-like protein